MISELTVAPMMPAQAARLVLTATSAKLTPIAFRNEPGLKPIQPTHRMITPRIISGIEWPGIGTAFPSRNFPMRGPSTSAPASAASAPCRWTIDEPAKSWKPSCSSQPPPHVQWATIG